MEPDDITTVAFDISREDFARMQECLIWHIPVLRYTYIGLAAVTVIVALGVVPSVFAISRLVSIGGLVFALLVAWRFLRFVLRRIPSDGGGVLGHHTIRLLPEGIRETTAVNEGLHSWLSVTDVIETKSYVFLVLGRAMVHAIPVRSFASPDIAHRFADIARRYVLGRAQPAV